MSSDDDFDASDIELVSSDDEGNYSVVSRKEARGNVRSLSDEACALIINFLIGPHRFGKSSDFCNSHPIQIMRRSGEWAVYPYQFAIRDSNRQLVRQCRLLEFVRAPVRVWLRAGLVDSKVHSVDGANVDSLVVTLRPPPPDHLRSSIEKQG